jgi:hypothetical protein
VCKFPSIFAYFPTKALKMNSFSLPTLKLRKDIWTHFPVIVDKVTAPNQDNRERYSILWHKTHLEEWGQGIPFYACHVKERLMKALKACDRWTVEDVDANSDALCVIAMKIPETKPVVDFLPAIYAPNPIIHTVEDLHKYFPVCWNSKRSRRFISLEFHVTNLTALSKRFNIPESELRVQIQERVKEECEKRWKVSPGTAGEICRVQIC